MEIDSSTKKIFIVEHDKRFTKNWIRFFPLNLILNGSALSYTYLQIDEINKQILVLSESI